MFEARAGFMVSMMSGSMWRVMIRCSRVCVGFVVVIWSGSLFRCVIRNMCSE